ncbi:MAG: UDP-N-acetylmuramate dehydrogenase [Gammaproteobacteria bacterium]|nr:MAG: UDP-N-acetylmuramate dehydrogenase [Gammaproteobacteria bacterium]
MPLYLPHFNLQNYNTLASPVCANFFVSVKNNEELIDAIKFAKERTLPLLVLGGGSNIVLYDDFPGLVIHLQFLGKELVREDEQHFYVKAAAGENWSEFVDYCLDQKFWGLENLSLIPGNVGAAPIQNIGAYGVELKDVFEELSALNIKTGLTITFTPEACQFGYRDSVFKNQFKDEFIITSVIFRLTKVPSLKLGYPALQKVLSVYAPEEITPELVAQIVCEVRRNKLPDPKIIPNVGSFFKNPVIPTTQLHEIQSVFSDVVYFPIDSHHVKLAAAWLIDRAGWRGVSQGAAVHSEQALVLTNPSRLNAGKVLELASAIKNSVLEMFGVELEQEPRNYP